MSNKKMYKQGRHYSRLMNRDEELVENYWRTSEGRLVNVMRPPVLVDWCLRKLGSDSPTETEIKGTIFLDNFILKKWLLGP
jgi:hypothetical protein